MKRIVFFLYGVLSYLAFFITILYTIGFVGNFVVAKSIDGNPQMPLVPALLIDGGLLLLFALQHSVMARPGFKCWWTKFIPEPIERSTYVLLASGCLMLLMWQWQPIGGLIWEISNPTVNMILMIINLLGWSIVFISTFLINHFDLFGLRQSWLYLRNRPYQSLPFGHPLFYRFVRHPLYLGFLISFWSASTMTVAHMFFALLTTMYILTAIQLEERDLVAHYGARNVEYRKWVPVILPFGKKKKEKSIRYKKEASGSIKGDVLSTR